MLLFEPKFEFRFADQQFTVTCEQPHFVWINLEMRNSVTLRAQLECFHLSKKQLPCPQDLNHSVVGINHGAIQRDVVLCDEQCQPHL